MQQMPGGCAKIIKTAYLLVRKTFGDSFYIIYSHEGAARK